MKAFWSLLLLTFLCFAAGAKVRTYVGSTPAHELIRNFLRISSTDSIDFIRWKLELDTDIFKLQCQYGLSQPGTPGFSNGQTVALEGRLRLSNHHYLLLHEDKSLSIVQVNANVLHFLDENQQMLIGNGGYSYALNSLHSVMGADFHLQAQHTPIKSPMVFEGRTPCRELASLLGLPNREACIKMKWYFLLYADSVTGTPTYFLMAGYGYRKETMARGSWQIVTQQNGRIVYRLYFDKWSRSLDLLKGDENILFFVDAAGRVLVGNEDFSYTLNRRKDPYSRKKINE